MKKKLLHLFLISSLIASCKEAQIQNLSFDGDLIAKQIVKNEGELCLEVVVNAKGEILPHHLEHIKSVGKALADN